MTIEECRAKNCVHASVNRNRRNCGVTDCSRYENYFQERWTEEEDWEFDDCVDEDYEAVERSCRTCRFCVLEDDMLLCNFPLIAEKFPDGVIDENPTNMTDCGIHCNRFEP